MSTVIKVENLSKQYRLGQIGTGTFSHDLKRWWSKARGKEDPFLKIGEVNDRTVKGGSEYVWALKDINFEVKQGEVLGIIGKNGAGKSTLLKILSRTTSPTTGSVKIKGRMASLLEVGTGFHPELTGRENIFMNGAILGMTKQEIKNKFDEIVDFSGVEKYIDTPVKRYSSGMYVRLAFAVAAHLDTEILIVDEVLAVGDADFQKKCLGKMEDVSKSEGRTILFVSHQLGTLAQICSRGTLLKNGELVVNDSMTNVISTYLSKDNAFNSNEYISIFLASDVHKPYFKRVYTINDNGSITDEFGFHERIHLSCLVNLGNTDLQNLKIGATLQSTHGYYISTSIFELEKDSLTGDSISLTVTFPSNIIAPNSYYFRVALFNDTKVFEILENICLVRVVDTGTSLSKYEGVNYGSVILNTQLILNL